MAVARPQGVHGGQRGRAGARAGDGGARGGRGQPVLGAPRAALRVGLQGRRRLRVDAARRRLAPRAAALRAAAGAPDLTFHV